MDNHCKDCIACQPRDPDADNRWFHFPEDFKCADGEQNFPRHGHLCHGWIGQEVEK